MSIPHRESYCPQAKTVQQSSNIMETRYIPGNLDNVYIDNNGWWWIIFYQKELLFFLSMKSLCWIRIFRIITFKRSFKILLFALLWKMNKHVVSINLRCGHIWNKHMSFYKFITKARAFSWQALCVHKFSINELVNDQHYFPLNNKQICFDIRMHV